MKKNDFLFKPPLAIPPSLEAVYWPPRKRRELPSSPPNLVVFFFFAALILAFFHLSSVFPTHYGRQRSSQ